MRFRPCIDLHSGRVKQIVGASLRDGEEPTTHFDTDASAASFAGRFRDDGLMGGHVIMLGPGNERAAEGALAAFPGGLQVGGGIDPTNAEQWLSRGAASVIATSYLFSGSEFSWARLAELEATAGSDRLVVDLSCSRRGDRYVVMTNRWQTATEMEVDADTLDALAPHCSEFLIHAVDVEGLQAGPDRQLIERLAAAPLPVTYAGGIRSAQDIAMIESVGNGAVDFTVGSALDLFGGEHLRYSDLVRFGGNPS